jgi:tripartite ATP-independent transporter DctP family solute receptor
MMKAIRVLSLFISMAFLVGNAKCETVELRFGHIGGAGSLLEATAQEFARRANERLQGRVRVAVYGKSALGDDTEMLAKVKAGAITFSLPIAVMESVDDVFGIFEMPFLIRDRAHMNRVRAAIFASTLQPAAKNKGFRLLALWEVGFRHITNNIRPIRYPDDLQGLRLRVPKGLWRARMFEAYGAIPVLLSFDKIVDELKKHSVDGQENPISQFYPVGIHEQQRYLTLSYHIYSPAFVVVSEEHFSKLPKNVQDTLADIAVDLEDWAHKEGERLDKEMIGKLRGKMEINQIDLIEFFHGAATGIYQEYAAAVPQGGALIAQVEALAKEEK